MGAIKISSVGKIYPNGTRALEDVNIEINDGEFVVLVGPSGCGKTTLLRMVAGLEDITEGEISIADKIVNEVAPKDRDIAMVFQNYALYPHMSVYDNMAFSLKLRKLPKDEIDKKVKDAAKTLEIDELLERKPKALSGGQRQRVAIGRAIVRDPKAFLFDEPLSNLDAELRVTMRKELSALHEKIGGTMIYVTHDQVEAMTLADQIVVLNEGYVAQAGAPLDLYNNPNDTFVAGFIGSPKMNFMNVKSINKDDEINLKSESLNIKSSVDLEVDENYTLGIRPEHIYICEKNESDLEVTVDYSEQLGSETYFYCNTHDTSQLIVHQTGQYKVAKGDKLFLRLDRSAMHLFGADGKAIKKNKS